LAKDKRTTELSVKLLRPNLEGIAFIEPKKTRNVDIADVEDDCYQQQQLQQGLTMLQSDLLFPFFFIFDTFLAILRYWKASRCIKTPFRY